MNMPTKPTVPNLRTYFTTPSHTFEVARFSLIHELAETFTVFNT
jgi:hypothetical protein